MAITVNTNLFSLNAQRNLTKSQNELAISMQRLSSGLRINSAKDDAAGLFTSEKMTADIRGLNQAMRNAADGISLGQVAEGALGEIGNNLQRIREIAVQAANSTVEDRSGLQKEVDQLTQEISRIIQTVEFNGQKLLSATAALTFQVGQDGTATHQVSVNTLGMVAAVNASGSGGLSGAGYNATLSATGTIVVSASAAASAALASIEYGIDTVAKARATMGAVQNRFEAVISNLSNASENFQASRSRIQDADFAAETARLTRAQILQQAGVSILAQANIAPQSALALLQ
jgi:flagellin